MWDAVIEPTLLPNPRLNLTLIETHYHEWVIHYHTFHLNVNIGNRKSPSTLFKLQPTGLLKVMLKSSQSVQKLQWQPNQWHYGSVLHFTLGGPIHGTLCHQPNSVSGSVQLRWVLCGRKQTPTANGRSETKVTFYSPLIMVVVEGNERKRKKKYPCCCFKPFLFLPTAEHLHNGLIHDRETTGVSSLWSSHVGSIWETWSSGSLDHQIRKETSQRGGPP